MKTQFRQLAVRQFAWIVISGIGGRAMIAQPVQQNHTGNPPLLGYLGIADRDIDAERAKDLKLPEEVGVEVTRLDPMSPAAMAGLRVGDVVVLYNNQRVEGRFQLERVIQETPPGREVRIQIYRNGYPQNLIAKIGAHVRTSQFPAMAVPPSLVGSMPDIPMQRTSWRLAIGVDVESIDGQLAAAFGVKESGVLVRSVTAGSAAERGGLRAGDVIIRVGDAKVATPSDVSGRIRAGRAQSATLTILRDRQETALTIPLDGGSHLGQ